MSPRVPAPSPPPTRFRHQSSRQRFRQIGAQRSSLRDTYHLLLTASWFQVIALLFVGFVFFNAVFATLYLLGGDCINAEDPTSWLQTFSFSVQTMAAIGYGAMAPTTPYAYILSNAEGFLGLIGMAMASGLMFAKFSRPTARITFSNAMVVQPRDGVPTLMFRASNERGNQIVQAQLSVVALVDEVTAEGETMRRLIDLELVRNRTPMFSLSWVAMHHLDEGSPLRPLLSPEGCDPALIAIVVNLSGTDDTLLQTVHARTLYPPARIRWGYRFADMLESHEDGHLVVHHRRIHDIEPLG